MITKTPILFAIGAICPAVMPAQLTFWYSGIPGLQTQTVRIVTLANGNTLFVGPSSAPRPGIELFTVPGSVSAFIPQGNGVDTPQDATVDPSGNIWIVGSTTSDDLKLVNPIVAQNTPQQGTPARAMGFVMEFDPTGTNLKFATYLGSQASGVCAQLICASYATAITADAAGNIYVGGSTDEPNFPVTPGAYKTTGPGTDSFTNKFFYSFVVKISPAGKLIYGTFLGTGGQRCAGLVSTCINQQSTSASVDAMAVDAAGGLTASESMSVGPGRISRLAPDATKLLWKTDTGKLNGGVVKLLLAQDASGAVALFGTYAPLLDSGAPQGGTGTPYLFAQKLSSSGSLLYTSDLGQASPDAQATGILLDSAGDSWLSGTDSSAAGALSGAAGNGADFLLRIDGSGAAANPPIRFPRGVIAASPAFGSQQQILIPGANGALLTLPAGYTTSTPAVVAFANAASFGTNTGIYNGAIVTLFGFALSATPAQIAMNGVPATVLYAGPGQINLQVPFDLVFPSGYSVVVTGLPSGNIQLPAGRSLGIFTSDGIHAAALNQDGTVNSAANPAAQGSIVTLYGTGAMWASGMDNGGVDGGVAVAAAPLDQEQNGFQIVDRLGIPDDILYAGTAPGIIDGVFQINVAVPVEAAPPFTLQSVTTAGVLSSNPFSIYLR